MIAIDMEENSVVKPWGKFKLDLCNLLVEEELRQAVLLVRGQISENLREKISEPIDLLEALEDNGIISEDRTDPLLEILTDIDNVEALEDLMRYRKLRDQYRENVKLLAGRHDPLFVGRDDYIRKIIDVFRGCAGLVSCVCLYGLGGTGKTTLAIETCAIYKELNGSKARLIKVDLRKRSNMNDVGVALLTSVGIPVSAKDFDLTMITHWIRSCTQQEHVIFMDNADELLQPLSGSRDHFINMMTDLMSTENPNVKIIITSRYAMRFSNLDEKSNFAEIEVGALEVKESIKLLVKECQMAQSDDDCIAEETAEEIANLCGNNPQALRAVAKRLKNGFNPTRLAEMLRNPKYADRLLDLAGQGGSTSAEGGEQGMVRQNRVLQSLKATIDMLEDSLQESLVRLSVFPGSFDRQTAKLILGVEDVEDADLEIDDLRQWSLVECKVFREFESSLEEADRQYAIHLLIRTVCMLDCQKGGRHNAAFVDALSRLCEYVVNLMQQLSTDGHKEYSRALNKYEEEKPIVIHFLEMEMGKTFSGSKLQSPLLETHESAKERANLSNSKDAESIYKLFEGFMDVEKREQYFQCITTRTKDKGELEAWAKLSGWLAAQYVEQAKNEEAYETLKDPLGWLESLPPPLSEDADLAKAQCRAIQGQYLTDKPDPDYDLAIKCIEESLSIRKKYLGDNSLTAASLNLLGHVHHRKKDVKAKNYHEQAWAMLARITNNNPEQHFDAPTYALNIGTAYHQLGNTEMDKKQPQKAKEYYRHAISFFDRAYDIGKRLRLEAKPTTAVILKNKAMSYCEMDEYENAFPLAIQASELRKSMLGTHPDTARSLYFVGSLYHDLGKKEKKASKTPGEDIPTFKDAYKYYKEALNMERKLGPKRRSWEYSHLKEDFKRLLKLMHKDRELQQWERIFQREDESSFDEAVPEDPPDEDEVSTSSGSPKRKLTGLEDMPESPKRSRCLLA